MPSRGRPKSRSKKIRRRNSRTKSAPRKKRYRKKPLALKTHNFVERVITTIPLNSAAVSGLGNLNTTVAKTFMLQDIPQHPQYATLFDEYRIDKVVATFRWSPVGSIQEGSSWRINLNQGPLLMFKVDHNDKNPDSVAVLNQSMRTHKKPLELNKDFSISLRPAVQSSVDAAIGNTYTPKWKQWISTSVLDVEHYALKLQVQVPTVVGSTSVYDMGQIQVEYKYYFTLKCND